MAIYCLINSSLTLKLHWNWEQRLLGLYLHQSQILIIFFKVQHYFLELVIFYIN